MCKTSFDWETGQKLLHSSNPLFREHQRLQRIRHEENQREEEEDWCVLPHSYQESSLSQLFRYAESVLRLEEIKKLRPKSSHYLHVLPLFHPIFCEIVHNVLLRPSYPDVHKLNQLFSKVYRRCHLSLHLRYIVATLAPDLLPFCDGSLLETDRQDTICSMKDFFEQLCRVSACHVEIAELWARIKVQLSTRVEIFRYLVRKYLTVFDITLNVFMDYAEYIQPRNDYESMFMWFCFESICRPDHKFSPQVLEKMAGLIFPSLTCT
jgi:hypothetical protein